VVYAILATRKRVRNDYPTLVPTTVEMVMTDATSRDYEIRSEVVAGDRIGMWPTMARLH
jgi:hypothetical protein